MAELADAHGSGPCGSNTMRVQVPFSAVDGANLNQAIGSGFAPFCVGLENAINMAEMPYLSHFIY